MFWIRHAGLPPKKKNTVLIVYKCKYSIEEMIGCWEKLAQGKGGYDWSGILAERLRDGEKCLSAYNR